MFISNDYGRTTPLELYSKLLYVIWVIVSFEGFVFGEALLFGVNHLSITANKFIILWFI